MKPVRLFTLLLPLAFALGQNPDLFDKAPPQIDEALRARVMIFYNAHVTGKFRDALAVVADDAMDDFIGTSRDGYKACEISKIRYSEDFKKAVATTACKTVFRWHGEGMPVTIPVTSNWKLVDGQWWWYRVKETRVVTPFGISTVSSPNADGSPGAAIPKDPEAAARDILSKVTIDKTDIELKDFELSKGEVYVSNLMPGSVTVSVDRAPLPGLSAKVEQPELGQGGKTKIVFTYDPKDPAIHCDVCTTKAGIPPVTANVRISPTAQIFPVKISFKAAPVSSKKLPKLPTEK